MKKLTNRERVEKEEARLRGEMVDGWDAFQNIKKEGRLTDEEKQRAQNIVDQEWKNYKEIEQKKEDHKQSEAKPLSEEEALAVIQTNTKILKEGTGEQLKNIGHTKRTMGRHKAFVNFSTYIKGNPNVINTGKNLMFRTGHGGTYVTRGFDIAVLEMRMGEIRRVICPPELAFGDQIMAGGGPGLEIPRYSTIEFEIELFKYQPLTMVSVSPHGNKFG